MSNYSLKKAAAVLVAAMVTMSLSPMTANAGQMVSSGSPADIVYSSMSSTATSLSESLAGATTVTMSDENSSVKISESGVYVITGNCSEGNLEVKKNTKGVTLILQNLTLKSTQAAPISCNKGTQVKIVISGTVNLTDSENISEEDTNEDFGGACIKVKAGADVYLTGTGTLNLDASGCKNGLKSNDDSSTTFVIDGPTINIDAANDGINAGYDLSILSGIITVSAEDDGIHADRILTIGSNSKKPTIKVTSSVEALEGTEVIILNGNIGVVASDDGINAANSDGTYSSEMDFLIDIEGGTTTAKSGADGLDSNGNINLIAGRLTINSANNGGDAGLDYDGSFYISDSFVLNNYSGVTNDSGRSANNGQMPGNMPGSMPGSMPGENNQFTPDQDNWNSQTYDSDQRSIDTEAVFADFEAGDEVEDGSEEGYDHIYVVNEDGSSVTLTDGDEEASGKITIDYITVNGQKVPVTRIANGAFKKNTGIKQVIIGNTVKSIGKNAFNGCAKLKKITIKASGKISIGKNAFKNLKAGSIIKVTGSNKSYNKKKIAAQITSTRTSVK